MSIGVSVPLPAYTVDSALMAQKAEELGFESIDYNELAEWRAGKLALPRRPNSLAMATSPSKCSTLSGFSCSTRIP